MRYMLILLVLLVTGTASAMDCEKVPTCEELGYSTEDDPDCADNGYMYCPFDHKYKKCVNMDCTKMGFSESDKSSWCAEVVNCKGNPKYTACNCLKPRCNIGDVFYSDGSCGDVKDYTSDKIPVGVVYYTNCAGGGKVINLKELTRKGENFAFDPANPYEGTTHLAWGYYQHDVTTLTNYNPTIIQPLKERASDLYDGKGNTDRILKATKPQCNYNQNQKEYYQYCMPQAAQAAHDFYPPKVDKSNSIVGEGHWYLPAIGELIDLYGFDRQKMTDTWDRSGATREIITIVSNTLRVLKEKGVDAEELDKLIYWSSTEYDSEYAWRLRPEGDLWQKDPKVWNKGTRVSLEF